MYVDGDGDQITVSSEIDVIALMESSQKTVRLRITQELAEQQAIQSNSAALDLVMPGHNSDNK